MADFPSYHEDSPIPATELEEYVIPQSQWGYYDIPKEMLECVEDEAACGVQLRIAEHPEHGWFVIQSPERPYIVMRQLSGEERQRIRDYFENAKLGDGILTEEQCKKFIDLVTDATMLKTEPLRFYVIKDREASEKLPKIKWGKLPELAGPYGYEGEIRFTCDECRWQAICRYSHDGYNTDGDCLASK